MKVQKFSVLDAKMVKSPGQDAEIYVGNLVDERNDGPVTIGYGRNAPDQSLMETMEVDDTMIVLEGRLSVSRPDGTVMAGPGEIVYMPKGQAVIITTEGAVASAAHPARLPPTFVEPRAQARGSSALQPLAQAKQTKP